MRNKFLVYCFIFVFLFTTIGYGGVGSTTASASSPYQIDAGQLIISLNDSGQITSLKSKINNAEYGESNHPSYLFKLVADGAEQLPTSMSYESSTSSYSFQFDPKNIQVVVKVQSKSDYATFEVTSVTAPDGVDVQIVLWGPIATTISQTVGESLGAAYDDNFAIGIKQLNIKTIGGWPIEYMNLTHTSIGPDRMPFMWNSAARTSWGSLLQSYTYDHTKVRYRNVGYQKPNQPVAPLAGSDGQLQGSKIALYGTAKSNILNTISSIQTGEGLFHPTLDGEWTRQSQKSSQSFLVLGDISSSNMAQAAQYAKNAGLNYVYSLEGAGGPWNTNGHLQFKSKLGGTDAGVQQTVNTAATYGIKYGVHTLSNFIDTSDGYVTPTPDSGLATAGSATLTRSLDATSTDIYVSSLDPFVSGFGNKIRINNELLSYSATTQISQAEWRLSVARHIHGTSASSYSAGQEVSRLWVNQYGGLAAGTELINAISQRMATAYNNTGIRAMSFDGLEAAMLSGYDNYGMSQIVSNMYNNLTNPNDFITEASGMSANLWDYVTRVSWGESNTSISQLYTNMEYMQRNLLPEMIGWLYLSNYNTVTLEYYLSKMASWNAGAGFQTSVGSLANQSVFIDKIKQWETARNLGAFTQDQRVRMRSKNSYWTLNVVEPGVKWRLQQTDSSGAPLGAPEDVFVGNTAVYTPDFSLPINVALDKVPTFSSPIAQEAENGTDGVSNNSNAWVGLTTTGLGWMQVDFGQSYDVDKIKLWQYFADGRTYHDVIVQLSNDPTFSSGVTTVFNNDTNNSAGQGVGTDSEYAESAAGKTMTFTKINARYARFWANGNSKINANSWVDAQVYSVSQTPASSISVSGVGGANTITVSDGTLQMQAAVQPTGANSNIIWRVFEANGVTPTDKAVIDANGLLTAKKNGTVKVVATTTDGTGIQGSSNIIISFTPPPINVALGKTPTFSGPFSQSAAYATDGLSNNSNNWVGTNAAGLGWMQIDFGQNYDVDKIKLWHYFADGRIFRDVIVQLSNDPTFRNGVTTVFNNDANNSAGLGAGTDSEYAESASGKVISFSKVNARYARFWINGNNKINSDSWVEAQVFTAPQILASSISVSGEGGANAINSKDGTLQLHADVLPPNTTNKSVNWSVFEADGVTLTDKATVDANGLLTAKQEGIVKVIATAADGSAVQGSYDVIIDFTAPVTTDDARSGWYKTDKTVTLNAIDSTSGIAATYFKVDGGEQQSGKTIEFNSEGIHTLVYWSVDHAGNAEQEHTVSISIDKTAPDIVVSLPEDGKNYEDSGALALQITLADILSGVDGNKTTVELDSHQYQIGTSIPLYTLPLGMHTFIVSFSDLAGNVGSKTVQFQTVASIDSIKALVTHFANSEQIDNSILIDSIGIANSLQAMLAGNNLNSFVNHVQAQTGKHISIEAAAYLLRDAQYILSQN